MAMSSVAYSQDCNTRELRTLDTMEIKDRFLFVETCFNQYLDFYDECSYLKLVYIISNDLDSYGRYLDIFDVVYYSNKSDSISDIQLCNLLAVNLPISGRENELFPEFINESTYKDILVKEVVPFYENLIAQYSIEQKQETYILLAKEFRKKMLDLGR